MNHRPRVEGVRAALGREQIDGVLITNLTNIRYLTGFSGTNAQMLVTEGSAVFFTDPRYDARARSLVQEADIAVYRSRLSEVLPAHFSTGRLGVEATTMTIAERDDLEGRLAGIELVPVRDVVEALRRVKDQDELALIREAIRLGDETFTWIVERVGPGMQEDQLAVELEFHLRHAGAEAVSFPPIVASGSLSAHIHHSPSSRVLEKGDLILFDFGCRVEGYCSDLSRTVVLGTASPRHTEIYELVLGAQSAAIEAARAGAAAADVDGTARELIDKAGHAEHFGHGLGHGVGLDIHEAPRLHYSSTDNLEAGDVVTAEPGIYLPDWGGIRIEDCVHVMPDGAEVLGHAPKRELIEI